MCKRARVDSKLSLDIIIPYYNREGSLHRTLFSLEGQVNKNFRVLVVDDGSINPLYLDGNAFSFPLSVIRQVNQGVSAARNAGAKKTSGDYLVFMDAGDEFLPGFTQKLDEMISLSERKVLFCATSFKVIKDNKLQINHRQYSPAESENISYLKYLRRVILGEQLIHICSCCFSRKIFLSLGGFSEGATHGEDHEFILKALAMAGSLEYTPQKLFLYCIDDNESITRSRNSTPVYAHSRYLIQKGKLSKLESEYLATTLVDNFVLNISSRKFKVALVNAFSCVRTNDFNLFVYFLLKRLVRYVSKNCQSYRYNEGGKGH